MRWRLCTKSASTPICRRRIQRGRPARPRRGEACASSFSRSADRKGSGATAWIGPGNGLRLRQPRQQRDGIDVVDGRNDRVGVGLAPGHAPIE